MSLQIWTDSEEFHGTDILIKTFQEAWGAEA